MERVDRLIVPVRETRKGNASGGIQGTTVIPAKRENHRGGSEMTALPPRFEFFSLELFRRLHRKLRRSRVSTDCTVISVNGRKTEKEKQKTSNASPSFDASTLLPNLR